MKKPTFLIATLLTGIVSFAQKPDPVKDVWHYVENIEVIGDNKEAAHATFISTGSVEEALMMKNEGAQFRQSLDGIWKFKWVKSPNDRPVTFMNPKENVDGWDNIKVPSNWELAGYDIPIYVNLIS